MIEQLRARLLVLRAEDRDSQGRFTSSGPGNPDHLSQAEMDRRAADATRGLDAHTNPAICANCSKMLNGPQVGHDLGYMPLHTDTPRPEHWSHSVCPQHHYQQLLDYYLGKGYTPAAAAVKADGLVRGSTPPELLAKTGYVGAGKPETSAPPEITRLRARLLRIQERTMTLAPNILHLRMRLAALQMATDIRGGMSGGRIPIFAMGADGHVHFAGSTPGPSSYSKAAEARNIIDRLTRYFATPEAERPALKASNAAKPVPLSTAPRTYKNTDMSRLDPYITLLDFGPAQLRQALQGETQRTLRDGVKNVMARNPGTAPKSKTKNQDMIDYIVKYVAGEGY